MTTRFTILGFLLFSFLLTFAQHSYVGTGGFSSTIYGPVYADTLADAYSRTAYVYPSGSLGDLKHNDNIRAISFLSKSMKPILGNTQVKVYLKSTNQPNLGLGAINWNSKIADGMTLVHQGTLQNALISEFDKLTFVFNQTSSFTFDTTGGAEHLQIFIEYTQDSAQSELATWYFETGFYVPAFVSNDEAKSVSGVGAPDSICSASTIIKPTLEIHYPRFNNDIGIRKLNALGTVPLTLASKDTIRALVSNDGRNTITSQSVSLTVSGSNSYTTNITVTNLAPFEERWVSFLNYQPQYEGAEVLSTSTSDDFSGNNTTTLSRDISYNQLSHILPNAGNTGDFQFVNTSADFASAYYCNSNKQLTGVRLTFNSSDVPYKLVIWSANGPGGSPGDVLYLSNSYITTVGTQYIPLVQQFVNGKFYLGIRKMTAAHNLIGYQGNNPTPRSIHYVAQPAGDTIWQQAEVNDGFIFDVTADLLTPNDIIVDDIITPGGLDTFFYHPDDSMAIRARIRNIGCSANNNLSAKLTFLDRFNSEITSSTRVLSLLPGADSIVIFDKIPRSYFGAHSLKVVVTAINDEVPSNNVLERDIVFVVEADAAVTNVFAPQYSDSFEVNKTGFYPLVRVINLGQSLQEDIPVVFQLVQSGIVLYEQTKYTTLKSQFSKIIGFDSISPPVPGDIAARFITLLGSDVFVFNDTFDVPIFGKVTNDVLLESVVSPLTEQKFEITNSFTPNVTIRNRGLADEPDIKVYFEIKDLGGNQIYLDSATSLLVSGASSSHTFNPYVCDSIGDFLACSYVKSPDDQYIGNDTLCQLFYVTENYNLKINSLTFPSNQEIVRRNSTASYPRIEVNNIGKDSIKNALLSISISDGSNETYADSINVTVGVDEVKEFDFSELLDFSVNGTFKVEIVNHWSLESTPSANDTLSSSFVVRPYLDVAVSQFITPGAGDTFELNDLVNLKVNLVNEGVIIATNSEIALQITNTNSDVVFSDTLSYIRLTPGSNINLQSPLFWTAEQTGEYFLEAKIISDDDEPNNNVISQNIWVFKRYDVLADSILFPFKDLVLNSGQAYEPKAVFINDGSQYLDFVVVKQQMWDDSLIFEESKIIEISSFDTVEVEFSEVTFTTKRDTVNMIVTCNYLDDGYPFNDTIRSRFSVQKINSVRGVNTFEFVASPNPFDNELRVKAEMPIHLIRLITQDGREVYHQEFNSKSVSINPVMDSGIYILEVKTDNGIARKRVVHINH